MPKKTDDDPELRIRLRELEKQAESMLDAIGGLECYARYGTLIELVDGYYHYTGGLYYLIGFAKDANGNEQAICKSEKTEELCLIPRAQFTEDYRHE